MEKEINENIIETGGKKYKFIEAEKSICCKSCDLRKDRRCHLLHRMCISDNRKDKKEGYFKRIEETTMENKNIMKKEELENYIPKGELIGFPKEIIARMLDYQEEQGNPRDISVFESRVAAGEAYKGFAWNESKEGYNFWHDVINSEDFNLFFEKYPKQDNQDNSQKFKVGDKVIYFITNKIGIVREVKNHKFDYDIDVVVDFGNNDICEYEVNSDIIRPFLLHYRDDYNYDVIDFNNLPKRQEPKRWRAEKEGVYNFVSFDNECWFFSDDTKDDYDPFDDDNYNSGNYFRTEVEAEIIAQKLNTYFKQLIQEEHEHKRI